MEVKINREIRDYSESVYFGLTLRQFIFSVLACLIAVLIYFVLKPYFGLETLSWLCILAAVPFAAIGFVKYNGMTAEKFFMAWLKSEVLTPKKLLFKPSNYYLEMYKQGQKYKDKNNKKPKKIKKEKKKKKDKKQVLNK